MRYRFCSPKTPSPSLARSDKLGAKLGAKLVLEKGDDAKDPRKVLKAAAASLATENTKR